VRRKTPLTQLKRSALSLFHIRLRSFRSSCAFWFLHRPRLSL